MQRLPHYARMVMSLAALASAVGTAAPAPSAVQSAPMSTAAASTAAEPAQSLPISPAILPSRSPSSSPASAPLAVDAVSATNSVVKPASTSSSAPDNKHTGSIVDDPVNEADYIKTKSCIDLQSIRDIHAIDASHVVFEVRGHRYMLNQLRYPCTYLHSDNVLSVNVIGSSVCNMDRLDILQRGVADPREVGGMHRLGTCSLGKFEEITKAQLTAINESARINHGKGFWQWLKGAK